MIYTIIAILLCVAGSVFATVSGNILNDIVDQNDRIKQAIRPNLKEVGGWMRRTQAVVRLCIVCCYGWGMLLLWTDQLIAFDWVLPTVALTLVVVRCSQLYSFVQSAFAYATAVQQQALNH